MVKLTITIPTFNGGQNLERAIKSTRNAFQLDSIKTKLINPSSKITKRDYNFVAVAVLQRLCAPSTGMINV